MAEKKPLVLSTTGLKQQIQNGDFIGVTAGGTGATDAPGARTNLGLGNVENKSSATIRGELTAANVTQALGYTPAAQGSGGGSGSGVTKGTINVDFGLTPSDYAEVTVTGQTNIAADSICQASVVAGASNSDFSIMELRSLAMASQIICDAPDAVAKSFVIRVLLEGYATGLVPLQWSWS